jgi:hypothetical protein
MKRIILVASLLALSALAGSLGWAAESETAATDTGFPEKNTKTFIINCDEGKCDEVIQCIQGDADVDIDKILKDIKADPHNKDKKTKIMIIKCGDDAACGDACKQLMEEAAKDKKDATSK